MHIVLANFISNIQNSASWKISNYYFPFTLNETSDQRVYDWVKFTPFKNQFNFIARIDILLTNISRIQKLRIEMYIESIDCCQFNKNQNKKN